MKVCTTFNILFTYFLIPAQELTLHKEKPRFVDVPESSIIAACEEKLILVFRISPISVSNIICFKESHVLQSNDRVHLNYDREGKITFVFDQIFTFDSGIYSIVVQNECGYSKYSFHITVEGMNIQILI